MNAGKEKTKAPYEKPRLRIIELSTEEIMGACKAGSFSLGPTPGRVCGFCRSTFASS